MIETLTFIGFALMFGLGVSFSVMGISLFYKIFFTDHKFTSSLLITQIALFLLSIGMTFLYVVIM